MQHLRGMRDWLVCFDLGGVLVRINSTWAAAARHAGVQPACEAERLAELGGFAAFEAFQAGALDEDAYLEALRDHLELRDADHALQVHESILDVAYPETETLVSQLHASGVQTACLSNTNSIHWRRMAYSGEFPAIASLQHKFASQDLRLAKPDPQIYRALERAVGSEPDRIVYFEDGQANVEGALECGWRAFLIDPHGNPAAQMREHLGTLGVLRSQ